MLRVLVSHGRKSKVVSGLVKHDIKGASWLGVRGFASGDEKVGDIRVM